MRHTAAAFLFLAALLMPREPVVPVGTHAVRGVVRAVDKASLVIARSSQRSSEMTFVLRPSTGREGTITVGAIVSVRYVSEDHRLIATAVFVQPNR